MTDAEKHRALFGVAFTARFQPADAEIAAHKPDAGAGQSGSDFKFKTEEIRVREMGVGSYEPAARQMDAGNEIAFTAVALGKPLAWVESLLPDSYSELVPLVQEVNANFFASYGRRIGQRAARAALAETAERQIQAGASPAPSASPTSSSPGR